MIYGDLTCELLPIKIYLNGVKKFSCVPLRIRNSLELIAICDTVRYFYGVGHGKNVMCVYPCLKDIRLELLFFVQSVSFSLDSVEGGWFFGSCDIETRKGYRRWDDFACLLYLGLVTHMVSVF